jgi:hypothetical protein
MHSYLRKAYKEPHSLGLLLVLTGCFLFSSRTANAQGNYEIQVYGADTVAPQNLMVEIHSNYTVFGQTQTIDGVFQRIILFTRYVDLRASAHHR